MAGGERWEFREREGMWKGLERRTGERGLWRPGSDGQVYWRLCFPAATFCAHRKTVSVASAWAGGQCWSVGFKLGRGRREHVKGKGKSEKKGRKAKERGWQVGCGVTGVGAREDPG